jgi:hypothetical protein
MSGVCFTAGCTICFLFSLLFFCSTLDGDDDGDDGAAKEEGI